MSQRTATATLGAIGALACLIACTASMVAALGMTPAWAYGHLRPLSALVRWQGLPVEYIGLVWFLTVFLCTRLEANRTLRPQARRSLTFWSAAAAAGLKSYLLVSYSPIAVPTAAATAAAVGLMVVSAYSGTSEEVPAERVPSRPVMAALAPIAVTLAVAIVVAQALRYSVSQIAPSAAMQKSFDRWFTQQHRLDSAEFGTNDGIRVVVFTDYQCPSCAASIPFSQAQIDDAIRRSGIVIETMTRDFPLESECNRSVTTTVHPAACEAAVAIRIVRDSLGPAEAKSMESGFYAKGQSLSPDDVVAAIDALKLGESFRSQYQARLADIQHDTARALDAGVTGTPTYFVNGVRLPSSQLLERALNHEVARLGRASVPSGGR